MNMTEYFDHHWLGGNCEAVSHLRTRIDTNARCICSAFSFAHASLYQFTIKQACRFGEDSSIPAKLILQKNAYQAC